MIPCKPNAAKKRHNYFFRQMNRLNNETKKVHRIILIGTGESGKSTFVKQMKLLSSRTQTFDESYKVKIKEEIQRNLIQALSAIIANMPLLPNPPKFDPKNESQLQKYAVKVRDIRKAIDLNPYSIKEYAQSQDTNDRQAFYDMCKALWNDSGIQAAYKRSNEYQVIDSAQYFLDKVDLLRSKDYKPTDEDVLQCRTKTLGIHTEQIFYNNVAFELVDVGGQREQRSKWIEAMSDGVTAVIFLTDVSAFDMTLEEDGVTNRLQESINLLREVWKKNPLRDKSIILFLNKQDKLVKKLKEGRSDIEKYFLDFKMEKKRFLYNLLKDLHLNKEKKSRKDQEVWEQYFLYFLPIERKKEATKGPEPEKSREEIQRMEYEEVIKQEYGQIQTQVKKCIADKWIDKWVHNKAIEEAYDEMASNSEFEMFLNKLLAIGFFKLVCVTHFIQNKFLEGCEQSTSRHVYPYPTTAIDKRNIDRVFDACKEIIQGKILTEIMA